MSLNFFMPMDVEQLAAPAELHTRNLHPVLAFAIDENAYFSGSLSRQYTGSGVTVYIHYAMDTATANQIDMAIFFERIGDGQQDLDSDDFVTFRTTGDVTVPGTAGLVDVTSIAFTDGSQMEDVAAGDGFRIWLSRVNATSDASGDLHLLFLEIRNT